MVNCPYLGKKVKKYPKIQCVQNSKPSIPIDRKVKVDRFSYINLTLEMNTSEDVGNLRYKDKGVIGLKTKQWLKIIKIKH